MYFKNSELFSLTGERFARNKRHNEIVAYNSITKYMPLPLDWMNDESALYYSQVYLRFIIKNFKNCNYSDDIEMSLSYFISNFTKLKNVTNNQVTLAKEIVEFVVVARDQRSNTGQ